MPKSVADQNDIDMQDIDMQDIDMQDIDMQAIGLRMSRIDALRNGIVDAARTVAHPFKDVKGNYDFSCWLKDMNALNAAIDALDSIDKKSENENG